MKIGGKKVENSTVAGVAVLAGTVLGVPQVGNAVGGLVSAVGSGDTNSILAAIAGLIGAGLVLYREKKGL